ncbi:MAG TPA: hypothetical protein DCY27_06115 [Desulfobacterales bacterium]|nr:hypothetical protein [Desulfobacterales bacterium]
MKFWLCCTVLLLPLALGLNHVNAGPFIAYSLKEAEHLIKKTGKSNTDVIGLGGITNLIGMVYDEKGQDLVLVGQVNEGAHKVNLDDFVVALRARCLDQVWPSVSIDKTPETPKTGKQRVRFEGKLANTQFGNALLEADVILKKLGLGIIPSDIWGVKSYFDMSVDDARQRGVNENVSTRFWFHPLNSSLAKREGVFVIKDLRIGVIPQVMSAYINGQKVTDINGFHDAVGERFSELLTQHFQDIASSYPEVGKLKALFDFVGLAEGVRSLVKKPDISFWLSQYSLAAALTPEDYNLLKREGKVLLGNQSVTMEIDGGIEVKALISTLRDGDINALKELVIRSKPKESVLFWKVPLEGWQMPGLPEQEFTKAAEVLNNIGCSLNRKFTSIDKAAPDFPVSPISLSNPVPKVDFHTNLQPQKFTHNVGGVMLRGAAKAAGGDVQIDLSRGNFSLVIDGENAQLSPEAFRRFITALWSVYYTDQDPGVSIDPVERGGKKQLVRYIGNVVNNDLGRVMREADYLMKKWAVGTEKPNLPGFKDVDAHTARHGLRLLGASRRFWFVPEDISFKEGGGLLLFDQGRMTLKTEYRLQDKGVKAEPADEAFARFFTTHYKEIAARYAVYRELFEYAKMVSLANYLKEQGVPLSWFLLANKDQVMVEDSPGTVDALVKGSRHFEGVYIEGGVDLKSQGRYILDQQAAQAIRQAEAKSRTGGGDTTLSARGTVVPETSPHPPSTPISFAVGEKSYTTMPQHSLTCGRDRRGLRYQTDLALRQGKGPGLEMVRYFNPNRQDAGEFGNGWHLLIPYRIKPFGSTTRQFKNVVLPERMVLVNLMSGEEEVLTFTTERYAVAGYVPEKLEKSQVVGLFLLTDASYRLADKLGNEFWFDQAGFLTDMIFSKDHRIHLEYVRHPKDFADYAGYQLKPASQERVHFLTLTLPKQMEVANLNSGEKEVLTFSSQGERVGYVPLRDTSLYRLLALMNNASFRLLKKDGTEIPFDGKGRFAGLASLPDHPLAKSISLGDQKITFTYTFGKKGNVLISSAHWENKAQGAKPVCIAEYGYDEAGRLAKVESPDRRTAHLEPFDARFLLLSDNRGR